MEFSGEILLNLILITSQTNTMITDLRSLKLWFSTVTTFFFAVKSPFSYNMLTVNDA